MKFVLQVAPFILLQFWKFLRPNTMYTENSAYHNMPSWLQFSGKRCNRFLNWYGTGTGVITLVQFIKDRYKRIMKLFVIFLAFFIPFISDFILILVLFIGFLNCQNSYVHSGQSISPFFVFFISKCSPYHELFTVQIW